MDPITASQPGAAIGADRTGAAGSGHGRLVLFGLIGLSVAVAGLLVPIPHQTRTTGAISDLVHTPLFGGLLAGTLLLLDRLRPRPGASMGRRVLVRILPAALFWIVAGVGIEWIQSRLGRTASWHDAVANTLGISAAAAGAVALSHRRVPGTLRVGLSVLAVALVAAGWSRPVRILHDIYTIQSAYPQLGDFETDIDLTRWYRRDAEISHGRLGATRGGWSMRMVADPAADVPGITLIGLPGNWSDMAALRLDATLSDDELAPVVHLIVQVISSTPIDSVPGVKTQRAMAERTVTLSRGRSLEVRLDRDELETQNVDLSSIKFINLLVSRPGADGDPKTGNTGQPIVVYFDDLRIVRQRPASGR